MSLTVYSAALRGRGDRNISVQLDYSPNVHNQLDVGQGETRSQELNPDFPLGQKGPQELKLSPDAFQGSRKQKAKIGTRANN